MIPESHRLRLEAKGNMALTINQITFQKEVLGSNTPVLVNFWAPWCGICRLVEPILSELQAEWGTHLKLVSINADENLQLANLYRLKTLPTVLLFDREQILCRFDRFQSRDDIRIAAADLQTTLDRLLLSQQYSTLA